MIEINTEKKILKLNEKINIDLTLTNIKEVLDNNKVEYKIISVPGNKKYHLTKYHIELQYSEFKQKLVAIIINFEDVIEKQFKNYCNSLIINDGKINLSKPIEKLKTDLKKEKIEYKIEEHSEYIYINPVNNWIFRIVYAKKRLKFPIFVILNLNF